MSFGNEEERLLIQKCLAGDKEALAMLQADYLQPLRNVLVSRGASPTQADDLVANLWGDCVVGRPGGAPLLEKYKGRSSLKTWLFKVGINLLLDYRRRNSRQTELVSYPALEPSHNRLEECMPPTTEAESGLVLLLRQSLQVAFDCCPPTDLLQLRLIYLHGLTQREVARMWGCHETTLSRDLHRALQFLADQTLQGVRKRDPRLKLTWDDFLTLCDTERLDFL